MHPTVRPGEVIGIQSTGDAFSAHLKALHDDEK
jgi:hypothetical protein